MTSNNLILSEHGCSRNRMLVACNLEPMPILLCPFCNNWPITRSRRVTKGKTPKDITQTKRYRIFARDQFKCLKCNSSTNTLTLDHIIPRYHGGTDAELNLQTLCKKCNEEKGTDIIDYRKS